MLRMVSFDMDLHWRKLQLKQVGPAKMQHYAAKLDTQKDRIEHSRLENEYDFVTYIGYLLYVPLYLAGPIITYNDFVSQLKMPVQDYGVKDVLKYAARLVLAFFMMEAMLHLVHPIIISSKRLFEGMSPFEISAIGYFYLKFIWLKLLLIWRFSRLWAMVDGIVVVENMRRCMSNNFSLSDFWRDWHCSFNRWLVRYLYVPLGGKYHSPYNLFVVFGFVAIWHDLTLRLLAWGWLIALLFVPESIARYLYSLSPFLKTNPQYSRILIAMGGSFNIFTMIIVNLVGFAVGIDGIQQMLPKVFCSQGILFVLTAYFLLTLYVLLLIEFRNHEYRREYARRSSPAIK